MSALERRLGENPWVKPPPAWPEPPKPTVREVGLTGPSAPQRGVWAAEGGLPVRGGEPAPHGGALGVLGCSGGSGESSLATILNGHACAHAWPASGGLVVLCARTTAIGLQAAQAALTQWVARADDAKVPLSTEVLGLAFVEDAPGRRPRPLRDLQRTIGSGAPRVWQIPWIAQWRDDQARLDTAPRQVKSFVADVQTLLTQRSRSA